MRNTLLTFSLFAISLVLRAGGNDENIRKDDATVATEISKTPDSKRWKAGFIVSLKGDTLQGKIKTLDFLDIHYDYQRVVAFKDIKGITQYSPNQLKSFSFYESANSLVTLQAVSSPEGDGLAFLKLYYTGVCKVYGLTIKEVRTAAANEYAPSQPSMIPTEKKFIQIKNSQFFPIKRAGFKKNMKEVFAAYPRIVAGLDSKKYTYEKVEALVRDYNLQYK